MSIEDETGEQINSRPWLYKKGQSGNPSGRPKGRKSMKQWVKEKLEAMTDEEREEFLAGVPKDIIWRLAEGNPKSDDKVEITIPDSLIEIIKNGTSDKN